MAGKIQLTPAELQAQAVEMQNLESEYSALFGGVSSTLKSVNRNWSMNLSNNFEGKINSAQKSFTQITNDLKNGAKVANTCAVTFESVDSQLSKLYCGEDEMVSTKSSIAQDLMTVSDVMQWIDEHYSNLPDPVQKLLKGACKKLFKSGVSAYEILQMMLEGDIWGVIWKGVDVVAPSIFDWDKGIINWTGLKMKAVSLVGELVTDEDGYIQLNDEKYMNMMENSLREADVLGFVWNCGGSFVQTVGKGAVDATCQLISSAADSVTEKITESLFGYGVSLSTLNSIMYEDCGWSPGHAFNFVSKTVSNGVDAFIDGGAEFWSAFSEQAYSDIKEFGNLVGNAATATVDFVGDALNSAGDWIKSWF